MLKKAEVTLVFARSFKEKVILMIHDNIVDKTET